ncbi:O-antigen ligase family protein [Thermodesulfobacteriota bacterium]
MTKTLSTISRYSLYLLLIFTPLARGSVQPWAIASIHIVTLIALATFLMEKSLTWEWKWIKTPLDLPFLILLILLILSTIFSLHRNTSIWSTVLLINYLAIFYLTLHTFNTRKRLRHLIYLIIGIATFLAIFGLFKRFGANPFPWWDYGDIRYVPYRLSSTYGNANHLAGYLEMAVPLALGLFMLGYRSGMLFLCFYLTILLFSTLILTLSRGGWIGTLSGLIFMSITLMSSRYFRRKGLLVGSVGGFIILAFIIMASTPVVERIRTLEEKVGEPSFQGRARVWGGVVHMIGDYPLSGTGPGTFATVFTQYQPPGQAARYFYAHNDYLHFVSETGLILIPIIIWMIIALYRKGFKKLKNPSRLVRGTTLGAMAGITAIIVHSIVDFNLHIPANTMLFVVLVAIGVAPQPKSDES